MDMGLQSDPALQVPVAPPAAPAQVGLPIGKILFALLFLIPAVTALVVLSAGPSIAEDSPEEVLDRYVDGLNDKDVKKMFDQTVLRFADDYQTRLEAIDDYIFYYDPHMTIISSDTIYRDDMTAIQLEFGQTLVDEVEDSLDVVASDFCILEYEYKLEYRDLGQEETFNVYSVCAEIFGHWYLVLPGYY